MSTAIQNVGGNQIIHLGSRLVVGIRLQGTIAYSDPNRPHHLKPRPYLRYLADTLKHLRCDVSLLVNPIGSQNDDSYIRQFSQRHFPLPFRLVLDEGLPHSSMADRRLSRIARNYTDYFRLVTEEVQTNSTRVVFIDSEINYRYTPVQTLILEGFEPHKKRLHHGRPRPLQASIDPLSASQQRRRDMHQSSISHRLSEIERKTAALQKEGDHVRKKSEGMGAMRFSNDGLLNESRGADGEIDVLERRMMSTMTSDAKRVKDMLKSKAPLAIDSIDLDWKPRAAELSSSPSPSNGKPSSSDTACGESGFVRDHASPIHSGRGAAPATPVAASLAISKEDFTLVALAEILAELAASETSVRDYLNMEVLVEKIKVPSHGIINYLPIENCDYINMHDWEHVRVEEKNRNDASAMPVVEEREEHKDLFK